MDKMQRMSCCKILTMLYMKLNFHLYYIAMKVLR